MGEDKFSKEGITFLVATEDDSARILNFLDMEFFPEEPLMRSVHMARNQTWMDKLLRHEFCSSILKKTVQESTSILALDREGEVIGKRVFEFGVHTMSTCMFLNY